MAFFDGSSCSPPIVMLMGIILGSFSRRSHQPSGTYIPSDGLQLAVQQIRDCIRRHGGDKAILPHLFPEESKGAVTDAAMERSE